MSNSDSDGGQSKPESVPGTSSVASPGPPSPAETESPPRQPAEEALDEPDLLTQAREFLASSAIRHQDIAAKRQFLLGKGLTPEDADRLLDETALPPPVPPRTYLPPTPPSQLPGLMISLARTIGILSAASGAALWIYHSSILPRLSDSYAARHALRMHQLELAKSLTTRLESLKKTINPTLAVEENTEKVEEAEDGPILDVLELPNAKIDFDELPSSLDRLTELVKQNDTSSTSFISVSTTSSRTLQSLTDLNAYITSETFKIPSPSFFRLSSASSTNSRALGPAEEEVRRELRALKGLVLNRRSFAPTPSPSVRTW